jgi:hypothetical protein
MDENWYRTEGRELRRVNMQVWKGLLCLMMSKGTVMELRMVAVVVAVVVVVVVAAHNCDKSQISTHCMTMCSSWQLGPKVAKN